MKKFFLLFGILVLLLVGFITIQELRSNDNSSKSDKLQVVASFYPLGEFAKKVGGDYVDVVVITPPGVEPHEYEPTPRQIRQAQEADLFLFNGNGLDPWAEKINESPNKSDTTRINMALSLDTEIEGKKLIDPHFWLNPGLASKEMGLISDALQEKVKQDWEDGRMGAFQEHQRDYNAELVRLDEEFREGLSSCEKDTIITSHDAFYYLASAYNFDTIAISGISPEEEPSAQKLKEVADLAKEEQISYIFFETLVSPRFAETIAREVGANTLALNPLEGLTNEEIAEGKNYISVMQENLDNLKVALVCK